MTIEAEDRNNLIRYRLEQADETIADVQLLKCKISSLKLNRT